MSFNNSIISYNKIEEIDEYKPISPPSLSSSSEFNENNRLFYYTFYLQSKYQLDQNDINYIDRSYSSPSLILLTNTNNNLLLKNDKIDEQQNNNISITPKKNNNKKSNNLKTKNAKQILNTIKPINSRVNNNNPGNSNNSNKAKNKKVTNNNIKIITNNRNNKNISLKCKKDNSTKKIDSSNLTIKNEDFKNRVEFDNKNQRINVYINNNIFNININKKNNSIIEENSEKISIEKIIDYTSKHNIKTPKEDNRLLSKKMIENFIFSKNGNKTEKRNNKRKIKDLNILDDNKANQNLNVETIGIKILSDNKNKNKKNVDNNTFYASQTNKVEMRINQFQKILKNNGLFNVLTFLGHEDLINILELKNRKLKLLINKSICNAYIINIRKYLKKYQDYLEVLKYGLKYSKIKTLLRIDLIVTIRFIDKNNKISLSQPRHFKLLYLYEYLKNKDKSHNKLFDCYGFDLFCNDKEKQANIDKKEYSVYLSKQINNFGIDKNDEILNIQQILPFKINDKGIFNLEIYSSNNFFINPSNLQIKLKSKELYKNIQELETKNLNNLRINEYEYICKHWQKAKKINMKMEDTGIIKIIKNIISKWFEPYFIITDVFYENIGLSVYKFHLLANKCGTLINNNINIKIIIKEKDDYIENEIKKNNLLFERGGVFEVRKGDNIIFYLSMAELKF